MVEEILRIEPPPAAFIGGHGSVPLRGRHLLGRRRRSSDAGIVDQHVEPTQPIERCVEECIDGRRVAHVGETRFCNTERAYADLPGAMNWQLDGARAVHRYATGRAEVPTVKLTAEEASEVPEVVHPLFRTHEETGRKVIYFNPNRTDSVVGLERAASDALLAAIKDHMTQPKYRYAPPGAWAISWRGKTAASCIRSMSTTRSAKSAGTSASSSRAQPGLKRETRVQGPFTRGGLKRRHQTTIHGPDDSGNPWAANDTPLRS
jgi:hypothetical protein